MLLILLPATAVLIILYKIRWHNYVKHIDKIPGPPTCVIPIVGNLHQFYSTMDQLWLKLREMSETYYPIFRLWSFEEPIVLLRHPDDAEILLSSTKHITKGSMYEYLHPWLGTGLLTSTGSKWKNRRRILTPAFHFNVLNQFVEVFEVQAEQLVASVRNSGREIHDVIPLFAKSTLNTICETAMGTRLNDDDKSQLDFRSAVSYMGHILFHQILNPWTRVSWLFSLLPSGRMHTRAIRTLHDFSTKIIEERKRYHQENQLDFDDFTNEEGRSRAYCDEYQTRKRVALLDLLINVWGRGGIDDTGIREEVDTFIFEGHDTTASALTFAVLLLAENQEIQERARTEVNEVFDRCDGKLGMSDLQNMPYLERCIKEALRLYPSVPAISRVAAEDLQMRDYLIPRGSTITLLIYDLHRDPNFWPDPLKFDPDRFLPDRIRTRHPFSYIPFSAGPRNCIGQKFAMLELKSSVAHLVRNFYMEPMENTRDVRLQADLVIRSTHPLRVRFLPVSKD